MRRRPWITLALGIGAFDAWLIATGYPTLSTRFAQTVRHPTKRIPTIGITMLVVCHLFDVLPVDPTRWAGRLLTPRKEVR